MLSNKISDMKCCEKKHCFPNPIITRSKAEFLEAVEQIQYAKQKMARKETFAKPLSLLRGNSMHRYSIYVMIFELLKIENTVFMKHF